MKAGWAGAALMAAAVISLGALGPRPPPAPAPGNTERAQAYGRMLARAQEAPPVCHEREAPSDCTSTRIWHDPGAATGVHRPHFTAGILPHAFWPTASEAPFPNHELTRMLQAALDVEASTRMSYRGNDQGRSHQLVQRAWNGGWLETTPRDPWMALVMLEVQRRGTGNTLPSSARELRARADPDLVPYATLYLLDALSRSHREYRAEARVLAFDLIEKSGDPRMLEHAITALVRAGPTDLSEDRARLLFELATRPDLDLVHVEVYGFGADSALHSGRPDEAVRWLELLDPLLFPLCEASPDERGFCAHRDAAWATLDVAGVATAPTWRAAARAAVLRCRQRPGGARPLPVEGSVEWRDGVWQGFTWRRTDAEVATCVERALANITPWGACHRVGIHARR